MVQDRHDIGLRPNFLFILTDQHRADHLGCYGNRVLATPHIDSLATRGTLFDRFYVASAVCMPNRATLVTGRMPSQHGVRSNGISLPFDRRTFVERLAGSGYRTALIGKCHLQNMTDRPAIGLVSTARDAQRAAAGDYDQERRSRWRDPAHRITTPYYGFQEIELANDHGDKVFGDYDRWLAERTPKPDELRGPENALPHGAYEVPQAWRTRLPEELYPTHYVAERSVAWLERHARHGEGSPFFLMTSFPDPHHPFTPPGRYWGMYDLADVPAPTTCRPPDASSPPYLAALQAERSAGNAPSGPARTIAVSPQEARAAIALTYGMVAMVDDRVGMLLTALERTGLAANTVVVFTSDHGDYMGDHGLLLKAPMHYQGIARVPFIWAEPERVNGKRYAGLAGTLDIAQTILARAQVPEYHGMQGQNLLSVIERAQASDSRAMLLEEESQHPHPGFPAAVRARTLVTSRYRLSLYDEVAWGELYDLENDPDEAHNLWDDPAARALRADLTEQLARRMLALRDDCPRPTQSA